MKMEMGGEMKTIKVDRLSDIRKQYQRNVVPSYARFDLALDHQIKPRVRGNHKLFKNLLS